MIMLNDNVVIINNCKILIIVNITIRTILSVSNINVCHGTSKLFTKIAKAQYKQFN